MSQVLPDLPLPPSARLVSREGGEEALQFTFLSELAQDTVADYYRSILSSPPWTLVNDTRTAAGTIALYAERKGPSIWVTVRQDSLGPGSYVTIAGAHAKGDTLTAAAPTPTPATASDSTAARQDTGAAH